MHISPNDTKQYQYITLNNQLRLLLISDMTAPKSAAALAVNVGHFDDPTNREGLAHYLEHMLFLGTQKYPKTGEFQNFINQHGGSQNAWTGTEHSCFFFDIIPKALYEGLDRFAQFFITPLFNEEALDKERQAIESEYRLKLHDDSRRVYQVHKETINPAHPFAKFSVGNTQTLDNRNGTSIRDEIIDFHNNNYSADLMTLAIMGPHDLAELSQWSQKLFADIPNKHLRGKKIDIPFVTDKQVGVQVNIEPIKDLKKLILTFPMQSMNPYYRQKPLSYFAHLLGYEGLGSLMLALKNEGWITSLSAGGGASGSNYREFNISIQLTESGLTKTNDIIQAVFQYIDLFRQEGFQAWRYAEKQAVMESAFQFQETTRSLSVVSHLVVNMQHYDEENTIYGDYMMEGLDIPLMENLLGQLVPENLRITLIAKGQHYDRTAQWYFTPYSMRSLTAEELARFHYTHSGLEVHLPPQNPFICYNLTPKPLASSHEQPQIIAENPGFRLWHLQDNEFRLPKGVIYIAIDSPHAVANTRNIVMTRLCVEMFLDTLAKQTYQAEIAGMSYTMYAHQGGITLSISGFSDKQPELLKMILTKFAKRSFNNKLFSSIKEQLIRSWRNAEQDKPISQIFNALTGLLQPNNPPHHALIEAIETVEVTDLAPFVDKILHQRHVEMFVYGDWPKHEALVIGETLISALTTADETYEESLRPLIMLGDRGSFHQEIHCNQEDSAVVIYYQSKDTSPRNIALYSLANHLMSATFFNEIRTKQQLGYMVGTGNLPLNRHPGIVLYVQSPNAAPTVLIKSIDEFLNAFYLVLLELNDYQWHSSKRGLWHQIAAPDPTLRSRAQRLWTAIGNKDTDFSQRSKVLNELKTLTRSDMMRFIVKTLKPRTANRLIMHARGNNHKNEETQIIGKDIGSIEQFQLMPKSYDIG